MIHSFHLLPRPLLRIQEKILLNKYFAHIVQEDAKKFLLCSYSCFLNFHLVNLSNNEDLIVIPFLWTRILFQGFCLFCCINVKLNCSMSECPSGFKVIEEVTSNCKQQISSRCLTIEIRFFLIFLPEVRCYVKHEMLWNRTAFADFGQATNFAFWFNKKANLNENLSYFKGKELYLSV